MCFLRQPTKFTMENCTTKITHQTLLFSLSLSLSRLTIFCFWHLFEPKTCTNNECFPWLPTRPWRLNQSISIHFSLFRIKSNKKIIVSSPKPTSLSAPFNSQSSSIRFSLWLFPYRLLISQFFHILFSLFFGWRNSSIAKITVYRWEWNLERCETEMFEQKIDKKTRNSFMNFAVNSFHGRHTDTHTRHQSLRQTDKRNNSKKKNSLFHVIIIVFLVNNLLSYS